MGVLVEADEAQRRARDVLTASAWGRHLTVEQFLAREAALRAHPFARAAMRTWLWTDAGVVLASCETFEVAAQRGNVRGRAWLVASVFTEPALRGRGFATALLDALAGQLRGPDSLALALFSEVGPGLYERAGFVAQPSWDVVLPVLPVETLKFPSVTSSPAAPAPAPQDPVGDAVVLRLTDAQCDWHVERERFYAGALGRPAPTGHLLKAGASSLALAASFQTNELHVLWYDFRHEADVAPLLGEASAIARACGLDAVRLWQTTAFALPPGARRVPRDDELPMLRPLDGGTAVWTNIARGSWA